MSRPAEWFDRGLQHERTALAWERTAIAMIVAGVLLARYAVADGRTAIALGGIAQLAVGGATLLWAVRHYDEQGRSLRSGAPLGHAAAVRFFGLATVAFTLAALVLSLVIVVTG